VKFLEPLESHNVELLFYLMRCLFKECPQLSQDNVSLIYLLTSNVDGKMLQLLVTDVLSQKFKIFSSKCVLVLEAALDWETTEQWAFWQLVQAHSQLTNSISKLIAKVESKDSEALTFLANYFSRQFPTKDVVKKLASQQKPCIQSLTITLFKFWTQSQKNELYEVLIQNISEIGEMKEKEAGEIKQSSKQEGMIQILLTELSKDLKLVQKLIKPNLLHGLVILENRCSESIKSKFSQFFGIIRNLNQEKAVSMCQNVKQTNVIEPLKSTKLKEKKRKLNVETCGQQIKRKREAWIF